MAFEKIRAVIEGILSEVGYIFISQGDSRVLYVHGVWRLFLEESFDQGIISHYGYAEPGSFAYLHGSRSCNIEMIVKEFLHVIKNEEKIICSLLQRSTAAKRELILAWAKRHGSEKLIQSIKHVNENIRIAELIK